MVATAPWALGAPSITPSAYSNTLGYNVTIEPLGAA